MSGTVNKDNKELFDNQLRAFAALLRQDIGTEESAEDAKIKELSKSIFACIREHPEWKAEPEVQKLFSERRVTIEKLQAFLTEDTADLLAMSQSAAAASSGPIYPPTSARLLFNLLADEFGANSSQLEGTGMGEVLQYVTDYIKHQKSLDSRFSEDKQRLLDELEIACAIEKEGLSSLPLEALLQDFARSKHQLLIPGGWIGLPMGHAIYYEVIPNDDETVNFRIFNTGVGIEEHQKKQIGVKEKVAFVEWEKIPMKKLIDPHFAQIIEEMRTRPYLPNSTVLTDYTMDDIYKNLREFLAPRSVKHGIDAPLMQPQKAGTCACRSLFAFIKSKLPLQEYQRLKLDLRIQALIGFINKPVEKEPSPEVQYHLVEKATKKLSQRVCSLYKRAIGDEAAIQASNQLDRAEQWLKDHKIEKTPLSMDSSLLPPKNTHLRDISPSIESLLTAPENIAATQTPLTHVMNQISSYSFNNPETFIENLKQVSAILQSAYENKEYTAVHFAIMDLSKKIPLGQIFWDALKRTNPEIEPAMDLFAGLSELFFKSCYQIQDPTAIFGEKRYALTKLLFTQKKLAQLLGYDIYIKPAFFESNSFYIQGLDPVIDEEIRSIESERPFLTPLEILPTVSGNSSMHRPPGTRYISSYTADSQMKSKFLPSLKVSYDFNQRGTTNYLLSDFMKQKYPAVYQEIARQNPRFYSKQPDEQDCLISASPLLPSWIQSMKKSSLSLSLMKQVLIVPLGNSPISLDFQYENRGTEIDISLEGLTADYFRNLPIVNEETGDVRKWSANQTSIKNPMIRELLELLEGDIHEKSLYSTDGYYRTGNFKSSYTNPSTQSGILELMHIFTSRSHSAIEALEYFTRHPNKLTDLDYQQLFQMACFNCTSCEKLSCFKDQIYNFLVNQIALSTLEGDTKTQVFLQRMGRYFKRYGCKVPDITRDLLGLLKAPKTTPEEKSLIYGELAAALSEYETLTEPQAKFLFKAKAWLEHAPISFSLKDPKTGYDVEKALTKHSEALVKILLPKGHPNIKLLNEIYTLINKKSPPDDLTWEPLDSKGMSPRFKSSQNDFYDPMKGRFIAIGQKVYLPLEIRDSFTFKQLFPNQVQGIARSIGTYEFSHEGCRVLVRNTNEGVTIEQYKEGEWLRFIPGDQLIIANEEKVLCALESRYLADKYHVWHSLKAPVISGEDPSPEPSEPPDDSNVKTPIILLPFDDISDDYDISASHSREFNFSAIGPAANSTDSQILALYDKKTGIKTYEASYTNGSITSLTRLADKAVLGKASQLLTHFEDPSYIQEWYDSAGKSIEIELPRFKLSFKPDVEGHLQCQEHPGFFLSKNQNLEAIGPCKYTLILENCKGEKRALLPLQGLEEPPMGKECLQPLFIRHQSLEKGASVDLTYFSYDFRSNGYLECSTKEGYLTLAKTLAVHHEYEKAAYYLRNYGKKLSAYSREEIIALQAIADIKNLTGDTSGEQVAIALYATYLLATNEIRLPEAFKDLPDLYKEYLVRLRNITALKLFPEEELHILESLLPEPLSHPFTVRMKELKACYTQDMEAMRFGDMGLRTLAPKTSKLNDLEGLVIERCNTPLLPCDFEKDVLITRPREFIIEHLVDIIHIARVSYKPKEKKWLETASIFLKATDPSLALLLKVILKNPGNFPSRPLAQASYSFGASVGLNNDPREELQKWWSKIISIAESLLRGETPPTSLSLAPPMIKAVTHPPTDRAVIDLPHLPFTFTPYITPNLYEDDTISTWTTKGAEAISVNAQLTEFLQSQTAEDPVESAEWIRLVEDAKALAAKPAKTVYTLHKEIDEIAPVLQRMKGEQKDALTTIGERILELAATLPISSTERALFSLHKRGRIFQEITLDDVFISLALKDPQRLLKKNPHLSQDDLNRLYTQASQYLQIASKGFQVDRCLALCEKINKTPTEELKQELGEQLNATRSYTILKRPEYLVFEYYAGIIMRKDQIAKLNDFLQGGTSNPVMEMIMGSGKSKVLLPLLGLLKANGTNLSMVVVPAPLFESVASDTQAILQQAFSKSLETLHFDRNSTFTKRSLEEIKTFLETIIKNKQCLIMTSKSIQSLMLKFIEYANTLNEQGKAETEELKVMMNIIALLQTAGNPLIDEADTVLNVLHEVSFSLGKNVPPKEEDIHLIGTLYHLLYSNPKLKRIARLESDPHPDLSAPPLSETLYHEKLKKPLAIALIAELIRQKKLPAGKQAIASERLSLAYLCRDESQAKEAARFFAAQSPEVQNLLALGAEELCSLLPHTLLKTSDLRYGLDKGVIAIPYAAANTPSHGSLFSNPYITMNYTYQIHAKKGIQEDILVQIIQELKNQAEAQKRDEQIDIVETIGYKQFCLLKGELNIPFKHNLHPDDLKLLKNRINTSPHIRQELIEKLFLPRMQLFENKLACNPINLIALFSKVSGFTGTLWNAGSMHRKIDPRPEKGTDAKTLNLLMEKASRPALIIDKIKGESMFEGLGAHDALIDAGGYFKEEGNLAIARKMALAYGKSVVFYNSEGVQTITDGKTETPLTASRLTEEERVTFYDQSHTTGADIKQKGEALGYVTIGRRMILRDLLQSVWRLRGLEKGQTVQFVMDEEVESIIKEQLHLDKSAEITFKEILTFVIQNQAKEQGNDNFKAFKQQLENLSQNLLLEVLTSADYTPEQKQQALRKLSSTWIKPANLTPAQLYGKPPFERPSKEVIKEAAIKCSGHLEAVGMELTFLRERIDAAKAEIEQLTNRAIESVHRNVISPQSDTEGTVEIEQANQVEIENEISTEIETESDNQYEKIELGLFRISKWEHVPTVSSQNRNNIIKQGYTPTIPLLPIMDQMKLEKDLEPYYPLFEGINISFNVLEWKAHDATHQVRLLGPHKIPFHHLIIDGDNVTLFSQLEDIISNPNYYNLTLGFKNPKRKLSNEAFKKVVKLKFLNGESNFTKEEIAFLETWLKESGVERMENFYSKVILKYQPDKKTAFEHSSLKTLFHRLKSQRPLASAACAAISL